jgi:polar amino acid transport system substrate-binding protein
LVKICGRPQAVFCILVAICLLFFWGLAPVRSQSPATGPASAETVSIAVQNNFPPFSFLVRGKVAGFTIDYLNLLSEKTKIEFTFVPGTWEENLTRFKNGEVDAITEISHTPEREAFTRFTTPYYLIPTVVYTRENSFSYNGVETLKGRVVGMETGIYYKDYLQAYPDIRIMEIDDTSELMKKLSFGDIDAVVTNINIGNYMIKQHVLENIHLAGKIDIPAIESEDLRIGVRKNRPQVYALLQEAINSIPYTEYMQLQDRWIGAMPRDMQETLMPGDRDLINSHTNQYGGFRLSFHKHWYPVDFMDDHNAHAGIAAQIFDMAARTHGLRLVEQVSGSLEEAVDAVFKNESDILPAIVPSARFNTKLIFTRPYLSLPLVIATRSDQFFVGDLKGLSEKHIGLVDRGELAVRFTETYPDLVFETVSSASEGLKHVQNKKLFAFVDTIPSIAYAVKKNNYYNIKVSGKLEETLPISAAVRSGNQALAAVLDKILQNISVEDKEKVVDRWISISLEENVDYTLVWQISIGLGLILVAAAVWLKKVQGFNRRISRAYALLEEKNLELEQLSITDSLTGLYNRHKLDMHLVQEKQRADRYNRPFSLVIMDIDHFKSVNDRFGHQSGDEVLRQMGSLIKKSIRSSDIPGRWGGEEFLIICPETDRQGAKTLAEVIRKNIQDASFLSGTTITISGGVAEYELKEDSETLMKRADDNLYKAKHSGRNRILG